MHSCAWKAQCFEMKDRNIYRVLQRGPFARDQVRVEWHAKFRPYPENMAAEIRTFWEVQRRPFLFNGQLARLDAWAKNDNLFVLSLSRSDYRTLLYSNAHIRNIENEWGADYFSRALGISAVLVTADAKIVIIRRSNDVGEFPGLFDVFGGHIDVTPDGDAPCVFSAMEQELDEEAGLGSSDFMLELIGLIEAVPNRKPELVFLAKSELFFRDVVNKATRAKDRFEYSEIIALDRLQLADFLQKEKKSLSPSAFGCLVLTSDYLQ